MPFSFCHCAAFHGRAYAQKLCELLHGYSPAGTVELGGSIAFASRRFGEAFRGAHNSPANCGGGKLS